jgi:dynein light intermediate chain 1, cytosolic
LFQPTPLPPISNPTPEQAFLAKNYDENSKKPLDPRSAFRNPADENTTAGIVGPLGSSSFNLPNVERALTEMEAGIGGGAGSVNLGASVSGGNAADRRLSRGTRPVASALSTSAGPAPASGAHLGRQPISPVATSPSPTGGQTQHEVLQNFFQSLLSSKDRAGTSAARTSPPTTNGTGTGDE